MFRPDEISRNAREHIGQLHHEARVESSLRLFRDSYRSRMATAARRFAAWIEPIDSVVRASGPETKPL